ncbi:glycosyltransferase family 4 protein [Formosa sp. PL04]|uniref:glycosyltransferase family 4 protein n=1 Tax=Formosa sp. PL04 TaxID=3081755 RepID=UPI002980E8A3|nr:glycosyltransferase family 4 protein [Formosa sp. PL04]MDW5290737.1 glycosyltransferase family 4 protein [Formosa sp. PL04]
MKIALVLAKPPGYSETFFNSKIKGLQENGHEITLFTGPSNTVFTYSAHKMNPKVYNFFLIQIIMMCVVAFQLIPHIKVVLRYFKREQNEGTDLKRIIEKIYLNSQLLKYKGDWIHFGFATLALDRELVAEAIGAKMAVSFRGFDINVYPLKHPNCYRLLWQQVDKVQSISKYLLQKAYGLGLSENTPYQIITPAVDLVNLPEKQKKENSTPLNILTIARFNWIKGIDYLIEVASFLKHSGLDFEWQVIGSGEDAEKEKYLYHIYEKELKQHVHLLGKRTHSETLKELTIADVYVQPSLNEGFCNAVLEAQALGIPCVTFNVGGLAENIQDKKTGWLVEPFDCNAMARRIIEISNLTASQKLDIADAAIVRVQNQFNLEQQKKKFHKFYTD